MLFVFLLWTSLEEKQKRLKNTYHSFLKPRAYFVTTVCIGEPAQQKLRPSINLSTNNNKALQLFAMRRCLLGESTIVPNREVCGLDIGEPAQQKLRSSINLSTNNSKAMQLFARRRCLSYESTIVPIREVRGLNHEPLCSGPCLNICS